jgi:hypothetical protein
MDVRFGKMIFWVLCRQDLRPERWNGHFFFGQRSEVDWFFLIFSANSMPRIVTARLFRARISYQGSFSWCLSQLCPGGRPLDATWETSHVLNLGDRSVKVITSAIKRRHHVLGLYSKASSERALICLKVILPPLRGRLPRTALPLPSSRFSGICRT